MTRDPLDQPSLAQSRQRRSGPVPMVRVVRRAANVALTFAMVGVMALLLVGYLNHYETFVVLSGSMGKAAPVGSLVVGRPVPPDQVAVGDVILMRGPAGSAPVLHRVIERTEPGGGVVVRTKGDANPVADAAPYTLRGPTITPVLVVPRMGYILSYIRSPIGWLTLILLAVALVCLALWRRGSTAQPRSSTEPAS